MQVGDRVKVLAGFHSGRVGAVECLKPLLLSIWPIVVRFEDDQVPKVASFKESELESL